MDTYGHLWTVMDTWPFVILYLCYVQSGGYEGPVLPLVSQRLLPIPSMLALMGEHASHGTGN